MGRTRQLLARTGAAGELLPVDGQGRGRQPDTAVPAPDHASQAAWALADPQSAAPDAILALGSLAGNGAVSGLLAGSVTLATGPGSLAVQREGDWGKEYRTRRARPGALTYEEYKAAIGSGGEADTYAPPVKDASQWGGHRLDPVVLSDTELKQILLPEKASDAEDLGKRIDTYLPHINTAFEMMGIDTVEAQADYLAHAAGESGELANLSEKIDTKREYGTFIGRGPVQVTWESGYVQTLAYLDARADELARLFQEPGQAPVGDSPAPAKGRRRSRLPKWLQAYVAALPSGSSAGSTAAVDASVTADTGPATDVSAQGPAGGNAMAEEPLIPELPVSAEDAARVAAEDQKLRDQIALMRETVAAIKADPAAAADPKYAFLFSAAYMHWTKGVKGSGSIGGGGTADKPAAEAAWTGAGPEDRWVTGRSTPWPTDNSSRDMRSVHERAEIKKATYKRAVEVLSAKMVKVEGSEGG